MPPINYRAREEQISGILAAAGWVQGEGTWLAPPGRGPRGPWSLQSAWREHVMGEAFRDLATKGWDVPAEYIGDARAVTVGPHLSHPEKSRGKWITLGAALRREGLPTLQVLMGRGLA